MNGRGSVALVAGREIRQRLRGKAFWIFTAVLCIAIVGIGLMNKTVSGDRQTTYDIAITPDAPSELRSTLEQAGGIFDAQVRIIVADPNELAGLVADGPADAAIDASSAAVEFHREVPEELSRLIDVAWANARAQQEAAIAGLSVDQTAQILQPAPLDRTVLDAQRDDDDVGRAVGTVSAILLFVSINFLGGAVLTGVVEEKTTAVVEVLLARVRAHQLLAGKVAGIGVVGLVQFAFAIAAGLVALAISDASVPDEVWVALPSMLFWFLGGFALYATLFALGGSFVSRQEDAQGAVMPISTFLTAAYILMFAFASDPGSGAARVLSVVPPFAPLLMPLRVATGSASVLEIALAAVLLVLAVVLMLRLAGRIYAHTLLHRGARLRWRQALRSAASDHPG
jgi:ABC-2 type transport system permease protein